MCALVTVLHPPPPTSTPIPTPLSLSPVLVPHIHFHTCKLFVTTVSLSSETCCIIPLPGFLEAPYDASFGLKILTLPPETRSPPAI